MGSRDAGPFHRQPPNRRFWAVSIWAEVFSATSVDSKKPRLYLGSSGQRVTGLADDGIGGGRDRTLAESESERAYCLQRFPQFAADASNSSKTPLDGQQVYGRLLLII